MRNNGVLHSLVLVLLCSFPFAFIACTKCEKIPEQRTSAFMSKLVMHGHQGASEKTQSRSATRVSSILNRLREADYETSAKLVAQLVDIGKPAVLHLISVFRDREESYGVRMKVAVALGLIADPRAIEPLLREFHGSDDMKAAAMQALSQMYKSPRLDSVSRSRIEREFPFLRK